jgi:hypothetical protein
MRPSKLVGLVNVSIAVDLKSFENLAERTKLGDNLGFPSQNVIADSSPFSMMES